MSQADAINACVQLLEASINIGAFLYPVLWAFLIVKKILGGAL